MRRTYNRFFLSDEHPVADAQVLDEVVVRVEVELNLEVSASVLLRRLRVLVGNYEVVHDSFLNSQCALKTYDCRLLLVEAGLVLFDALLATEEHEAVTHVEAIVFAAVVTHRLVDALVDAVCIAAVVSVKLRVGAL